MGADADEEDDLDDVLAVVLAVVEVDWTALVVLAATVVVTVMPWLLAYMYTVSVT